MPYATAQQMVDTFGAAEMRDLSDIGSPRLGEPDTVVLDKALADASTLIDGYLVGRYPLPLAEPTPAVLNLHCRQLARYSLMRSAPDERAKADFAAALSYLKQVAQGQVALLPPSQATVPVGMGPVIFNTGEKVFARGAE